MKLFIFRKLIEMIDDDFNRYKHIGGGLLSFLTNNRNISNEMIDEILSNPKLVFDEFEIKNAFNNCFHCHGKSFNLLTKVFDFDKKYGNFMNLNKSGPFGKSYFTYLLPDSDFRIVNFLLENGADPNIPDISGYYPLECAINMNSLEFVLALIDSNKIDYSKRIIEKPNDFQSNKDPPSNSSRSTNSGFSSNQGLASNSSWLFNSGFSSNQGLTSNSSLKSNSGLESNPNQFINHITYLHLAARSVNEQILEIFLDNKLIDVNVTDDFGNTPLIDACKFKIVTNIERLFKVDNLDYSHCNKYGKDALKTLSPTLIRNDSKTLSKDEYLALILNHFENPNLNFAYIFPPDQ